MVQHVADATGMSTGTVGERGDERVELGVCAGFEVCCQGWLCILSLVSIHHAPVWPRRGCLDSLPRRGRRPFM